MSKREIRPPERHLSPIPRFVVLLFAEKQLNIEVAHSQCRTNLPTIYDFTVTDIDGNQVSLEKYR